MNLKHLFIIPALLLAGANAHALTLGAFDDSNDIDDPAGIYAVLPEIAVSEGDAIVVAISGNKALSLITGFTVNLTAVGDAGSVVASATEVQVRDSDGSNELAALFWFPSVAAGTYDIYCQTLGLPSGTFKFGYQILQPGPGETISVSSPVNGVASGDATASLILDYQATTAGGYVLEVLSANDAWTGHPPDAVQIFSGGSKREYYSYAIDSTGAVQHVHDIDFGGTSDAAVGVGAYFSASTGSVDTWKGYPIGVEDWVDATGWLGWVQVAEDPWIYSLPFSGWIYIPESQTGEGGGWAYVLR
jgi:hypothetical protein